MLTPPQTLQKEGWYYFSKISQIWCYFPVPWTMSVPCSSTWCSVVCPVCHWAVCVLSHQLILQDNYKMSDLLSQYCSLSLSLSLIFADGLKSAYSSHMLNYFLGVKAFFKQWSENPINHVCGNQNSSQGKWNIISHFHQASCCPAPEFINQAAYLSWAWKKLLPDVKWEKVEMWPAGPQLSKTLACPCSAFHNQFNTCYFKGQCEMQVACAARQVFLAIHISFLASEGAGSAMLYIRQSHLPGAGKAEGQEPDLWYHRALWKLCTALHLASSLSVVVRN